MGWTQRKTELRKKAAAIRPPRPLDYDQRDTKGIRDEQKRLREEFYERQGQDAPVYLDE